MCNCVLNAGILRWRQWQRQRWCEREGRWRIASLYGIFMSCSCHFFPSIILALSVPLCRYSYLYIWHCGDNTIMSHMIYGGGPFEKSPSRARRNHVCAEAKALFYRRAYRIDKQRHTLSAACKKERKNKANLWKHAVANYFIESEMNDLITHDSFFVDLQHFAMPTKSTTILGH